MSLSSIRTATSFFDPIAQGKPVFSRAMSVNDTSDNGLISFLVAEESAALPADTQEALEAQKQCLVDLAGVANAYVRNKSNSEEDPDLMYDVNLWQRVYNHLPLMGPSRFESQQFNKSIKGVEIATEFIETILGFAVAQGAGFAAFADFLESLGNKIKAGKKDGGEKYNLGMIAVVLDTQKLGNRIAVNGYLKGYFIDFSEVTSEVYSSCASVDTVNINFTYRNAVSLFNYGALSNSDVRKRFDSFITETQGDDISNSANFFSAGFQKS